MRGRSQQRCWALKAEDRPWHTELQENVGMRWVALQRA
jgi:hypothetical protein